jgi:hypothetical protein
MVGFSSFSVAIFVDKSTSLTPHHETIAIIKKLT